MAKKRSRTLRTVVPPETNDFKLINGIGPAAESRLHGTGIYTFAQLAALSPADVAASVAGLAGLTAERIIKQDWLGQARELASKPSLVEPEWLGQLGELTPTSTPPTSQNDTKAGFYRLEATVILTQTSRGSTSHSGFLALTQSDLCISTKAGGRDPRP